MPRAASCSRTCSRTCARVWWPTRRPTRSRHCCRWPRSPVTPHAPLGPMPPRPTRHGRGGVAARRLSWLLGRRSRCRPSAAGLSFHRPAAAAGANVAPSTTLEQCPPPLRAAVSMAFLLIASPHGARGGGQLPLPFCHVDLADSVADEYGVGRSPILPPVAQWVWVDIEALALERLCSSTAVPTHTHHRRRPTHSVRTARSIRAFHQTSKPLGFCAKLHFL